MILLSCIGMNLHTLETPLELGQEAAARAAELIRSTLDEKGAANLILATGASQFEMLKNLVASPDIDWSCVTMFHLDEYIGLPASHPASFRKYLKERFIHQVEDLGAAYLVNGNAPDIEAECARLGKLIQEHPIDVALIGIGENGHLAFNDPPADFETEELYIVVQLDEACRKQQMGEGWFAELSDVPLTAISMSVRQILKSKHLIVSVPDERKAAAVKCAVRGPINPECPASILQEHPNCDLYLDTASASRL